MKSILLISLVLSVPNLTEAVAFAGPSATAQSPFEAALVAAASVVTNAPSLHDIHLRPRAAASSLCGYGSGDAGDPWTCKNSGTCLFAFAAGTAARGCCTGNDRYNCGYRFGCSGYYDATSRSINSYTLQCSDSASPYCVYITYPAISVTDYVCSPLSRSTYLTILSTYLGQTDGRPFITFQVTGDLVSGSSPSTSSGAPISSTTSDIPATTTVNPTPPGPSTPVGAIVGGVIGGLALIGALIGLLIFLRITKKKKQNQNDTDGNHNSTGAAGVPIAAVPDKSSTYYSQSPPLQSPAYTGTSATTVPPLYPQMSGDPHMANHGATSPGPNYYQGGYMSPPLAQPTSPANPMTPELTGEPTEKHAIPTHKDGVQVHEAPSGKPNE